MIYGQGVSRFKEITVVMISVSRIMEVGRFNRTINNVYIMQTDNHTIIGSIWIIV